MSDTSAAESSGSDHSGLLWYLLVIGAAVAAYFIAKGPGPDDPPLVDVDNFSIFAPMYIVAQAVERFLEPISKSLDDTPRLKLEVRVATASKAKLEALPAGDAGRDGLPAADAELAKAQAALAKARATRAIKLWGLASTISLLVCAFFGLGLIEAVSKSPSTNNNIQALDVVLTGLAVGAGTKPLHDLISRIEKAKDNADPVAQPPATPPAPAPAPTTRA